MKKRQQNKRKHHNHSNRQHHKQIQKVNEQLEEELKMQVYYVMSLLEQSPLNLSNQQTQFAYLIDQVWFNKWKDYCAYDQIINNEDITNNRHFGQPDKKPPQNINSHIIEKDDLDFLQFTSKYDYLNVYIRPEIFDDEDYIMVDYETWSFFKENYEGIEIKRPIMHLQYDYDVQVDLLQYYVYIVDQTVIQAIRNNDDPKNINNLVNFKSIQLHNNISYQQLKQFIKDVYENSEQQSISTDQIDIYKIDQHMSLEQFRQYFTDRINDDRIQLQAQLIDEPDDRDIEKVLKYKYYLVADIKHQTQTYKLVGYRSISQIYQDQLQIQKGYCEGCSKQTRLSYFCICKQVFYCSQNCKYDDTHFHSNICSQAYDSSDEIDDDQEQQSKPQNQQTVYYYSGLFNIGNSCYMNSVIQCLYSLNGIYKTIVSNDFNKQQCLSGKLKKTFIEMNRDNKDAVYLYSLRNIFQKSNEQFRNKNQQDSCEFYNYFLDQLQTENQNIFDKHFQGRLRSILECQQCQNQSIQNDVFNLLQLSIDKSQQQSKQLVYSVIINQYNKNNLIQEYYFEYSQNDSLDRLIVHLQRQYIGYELVFTLWQSNQTNIIDYSGFIDFSIDDFYTSVLNRQQLVIYCIDEQLGEYGNLYSITFNKLVSSQALYYIKVAEPIIQTRLIVLDLRRSSAHNYIQIIQNTMQQLAQYLDIQQISDQFYTAKQLHSEFIDKQQYYVSRNNGLEFQQIVVSYRNRKKNTNVDEFVQGLIDKDQQIHDLKDKLSKQTYDIMQQQTVVDQIKQQIQNDNDQQSEKQTTISQDQQQQLEVELQAIENMQTTKQQLSQELEQLFNNYKQLKTDLTEFISLEFKIQELLNEVPIIVNVVNNHKEQKLVYDVFGLINQNQVQIHVNIQSILKNEIIFDEIQKLKKDKKKKQNDLNDCIQQYLQKEQLEEQVDCEKCGCKRDVTKQIMIEQIPECLVIQLKRFQIDKDKKSKLTEMIHYEPTLVLNEKKYLQSDIGRLNLTGVVIHEGSLNKGHYYSYCKGSDDIWRKFNDHKVSTIEQIISKDTYMLFYQQ